jgi:hypothetical protein
MAKGTARNRTACDETVGSKGKGGRDEHLQTVAISVISLCPRDSAVTRRSRQLRGCATRRRYLETFQLTVDSPCLLSTCYCLVLFTDIRFFLNRWPVRGACVVTPSGQGKIPTHPQVKAEEDAHTKCNFRPRCQPIPTM